jgi:hypothetical protein
MESYGGESKLLGKGVSEIKPISAVSKNRKKWQPTSHDDSLMVLKKIPYNKLSGSGQSLKKRVVSGAVANHGPTNHEQLWTMP